jgi:thioredoxin 1
MFQAIPSPQSNRVDQSALTTLQQQSEKPILVKFTAPHCSGCKTLQPILEELIHPYPDRIHFVEIDITEDPELTIELDVRTVPTVALFQATHELGRLVGLQAKKHYANLVQQAL